MSGYCGTRRLCAVASLREKTCFSKRTIVIRDVLKTNKLVTLKLCLKSAYGLHLFVGK